MLHPPHLYPFKHLFLYSAIDCFIIIFLKIDGHKSKKKNHIYS